MKQVLKDFLADSTSELLKHKFSVNFEKTKKLDGHYGGLFNDYDKSLRVATGRAIKDWFPIYVHEFNHFKQYIENTKIWKTGGDGCTIFFTWLEDDYEYTKKQLEKACFDCMSMELDCERRTLQTIKDNNLPFDMVEYAKLANIYMYFYKHSLKTKKWYDGTRDKDARQKLMDMMPETLFDDPKKYWKTPKGYADLMEPLLF